MRWQGPWRDVDHVEIETLNWVDWFNTERPHEYLDDLTPARVEELRYCRDAAKLADRTDRKVGLSGRLRTEQP